MEKMADKSKAKDEMKKAGVPVVPGSDGSVHSVEEAKKIAAEIGYPIRITSYNVCYTKLLRYYNNSNYY